MRTFEFFFHPVIWIEWTLKYSLTKRSSNEANTHTHSLSQHRNSNHINISKHRNQLIIQTNSNDCVAFRLLLFHSMHINKNEGVFHHHYIRIDWCAASTKQMEIRSKGRRKKNSAHTLMFMPSQRLSTSHDTKWKLKFGVRKRRHFFFFLIVPFETVVQLRWSSFYLAQCADWVFNFMPMIFFHPSSFSLPFFFASQNCVHY